jgi:pimeloyl-ACP methyl ester carboxylesterase
LIVGLALVGAIYQAIATEIDRRTYPPPGQLIDVGGHKLHIHCLGEGSPTVILDHLGDGTSAQWGWVQPAVATATRVCAYDRAGHGWSDPGAEPRDAHHQARELHALLTNANIPGPYVLVGHSLGGLYVRMYADQHPSDVAGMVLIEGTHPDVWTRLGMREGIGVDDTQLAIAPAMARLGIFRLGLYPLSPPDLDLPPQQRAEVKAYYATAKYLDSLLAVNRAFSVALAQVRSTGTLNARPLVVVIGGASDNASGVARELQDDLARLSSNSTTRVVDGATHAGLVDNRDHAAQTSAAILQVVEAAQSGRPLAR